MKPLLNSNIGADITPSTIEIGLMDGESRRED
jgi:hypothetical protein